MQVKNDLRCLRQKTLEINGLKSSSGILVKSRKITGDSMLIITWASSGKACMGQKQI